VFVLYLIAVNTRILDYDTKVGADIYSKYTTKLASIYSIDRKVSTLPTMSSKTGSQIGMDSYHQFSSQW